MAFTLAYMVFEGILWPTMNVFGHVRFVVVAPRYGAALPLVLWWAQLTVLDLAAALYCVAVEEEELRLVPCLSAVILVATIATILLAIGSYVAFKLRDKRRPRGQAERPVFFHRCRIEDDEATAARRKPA
jgi:hypothetical protein